MSGKFCHDTEIVDSDSLPRLSDKKTVKQWIRNVGTSPYSSRTLAVQVSTSFHFWFSTFNLHFSFIFVKTSNKTKRSSLHFIEHNYQIQKDMQEFALRPLLTGLSGH